MWLGEGMDGSELRGGQLTLSRTASGNVTVEIVGGSEYK